MSAGLFVIRNPYADQSRLIERASQLAHEKLMLQLRLSYVIEREQEVKAELAAIALRLEAQS